MILIGVENSFNVIPEENHEVNKRKVSLTEQFDQLNLKQPTTYSSINETESRFI